MAGLAQPQINGSSVPNPLYLRGRYVFFPQTGIVAADGTTSAVGRQRAVWRFDWISASDLDWFVVTLMSNAAYLDTDFKLWVNDSRTATQVFATGVMYAPDLREAQPMPNGRYGPIEIRFDWLLPLYTEPTPFLLDADPTDTGTVTNDGSYVLLGEDF